MLAILSKTLSTIIGLHDEGKWETKLFKVTQYDAFVLDANSV